MDDDLATLLRLNVNDKPPTCAGPFIPFPGIEVHWRAANFALRANT